MNPNEMIVSNPHRHQPVGQKYIGYWRSERQPELPDPRDFIGEMEDRAKIIGLLQLGTTHNAWMGYSSCRICNEKLGARCLTFDGTWVWPEKLEHYVEEHGLALPQEFVDHLNSIPDELMTELRRHHRAKDDIKIEHADIGPSNCPEQGLNCGSAERENKSCHMRTHHLYGFCGLLYGRQSEAWAVERKMHKGILRPLMKIPWNF